MVADPASRESRHDVRRRVLDVASEKRLCCRLLRAVDLDDAADLLVCCRRPAAVNSFDLVTHSRRRRVEAFFELLAGRTSRCFGFRGLDNA
ncbi:MAG TPA: hypothetical protein VGB55_06575 [Tepidisphaeraceae bacterium]